MSSSIYRKLEVAFPSTLPLGESIRACSVGSHPPASVMSSGDLTAWGRQAKSAASLSVKQSPEQPSTWAALAYTCMLAGTF